MNKDFFSLATMSHCFSEQGWVREETAGIVECMSLIHYPHFLLVKTSSVIIVVLHIYKYNCDFLWQPQHIWHLPPLQQAEDTLRLCMSARRRRLRKRVFIDSGMLSCICASAKRSWFTQGTALFYPLQRPQAIWQAGWHSLLSSMLLLAKAATPQCCLMLIKSWSTKQTFFRRKL